MISGILTIGLFGWMLAGALLIAGFAVCSVIIDRRRGRPMPPPARGEIGTVSVNPRRPR